ncbi:hypothetical protein [Gordonia sp. NPDC003376]
MVPIADRAAAVVAIEAAVNESMAERISASATDSSNRTSAPPDTPPSSLLTGPKKTFIMHPSQACRRAGQLLHSMYICDLHLISVSGG